MIKKRYTVIGIKKGKEINLKKFISLKRAKKHAQNLYLILEPLETDISCIYVEEKETEIIQYDGWTASATSKDPQ